MNIWITKNWTAHPKHKQNNPHLPTCRLSFVKLNSFLLWNVCVYNLICFHIQDVPLIGHCERLCRYHSWHLPTLVRNGWWTGGWRGIDSYSSLWTACIGQTWNTCNGKWLVHRRQLKGLKNRVNKNVKK